MPQTMTNITIFWDDPGEARLCVTLHDEWTVSDCQWAVEEITRLVKTRPHQIGVIVALPNPLAPPQGVLRFLQNLNMDCASNYTYTVLVGGGNLVHTFVNVLKTVNPYVTDRIVFADDMEQARRILTQANQDH